MRYAAEKMPELLEHQEEADSRIEMSAGAHRMTYNTIPVPDGTPTPQPSGAWKRLITHLFPTGFVYEFKKLFEMAWPMISTIFLANLLSPVSLMFSGHLGKMELDAVAMAISIANVIGSSIAIGMVSACDTFFSQSYGSANKTQVGIYLQTALYIVSIVCITSFSILFNTYNILINLGQNPIVARYTEDYLLIFMPAIYFNFLFQLFTKYLQIQGYVLPGVCIGVICNIINAVLQYVFVYAMQFGFLGSAIAQEITYFLLFVVTLGYIIIAKRYTDTWPGFNRAAFLEWGIFMTLAMSSLLMVCLEWWTFELATFLMGVLGDTELGSSSILFQIWNTYAAIPIGLGAACSIRIGRYLGAMDPQGAICTMRISYLIGAIVGLVGAVLILALKNQIPYIFASDQGIIEMSSSLLGILSIFALLAGFKFVGTAVVRGTGRQVIGGVVSFVSYFILAMPIGIPLMFLTDTRAAGFWWGLDVGLAFSTIVLVVIVYRTNWALEAEEAQKRAKVKRKLKEEIYRPQKDGNITESQRLLHKEIDAVESAPYPHLTASVEAFLYGSGRHDHDIADILEASMNHSLAQMKVPGFWRWVVIKRLIALFFALGVLIFGIVCRFVLFVPPTIEELEAWLNITVVNTTSYPMENVNNVNMSNQWLI